MTSQKKKVDLLTKILYNKIIKQQANAGVFFNSQFDFQFKRDGGLA